MQAACNRVGDSAAAPHADLAMQAGQPSDVHDCNVISLCYAESEAPVGGTSNLSSIGCPMEPPPNA